MIYTVQIGDTLSAIARRFNSNVNELRRLNGIEDPNKLRVGQSLKLPGTASTLHATTTSSSKTGEPWSQTVLRFVDALGKPIQDLLVRAVVEGREMLMATGADGCIRTVACQRPESVIDIHVQRAAFKGGGEKHIGSIKPSPGKQTVKVQSGQHTATTKIRRHEGTPQTPPQKMRGHARGEKIETATSEGHPLVCVKGCECPNDDDLRLAENIEFKEWIKAAGNRAGMLPQAVAAVMNAEAAKLKGGKWNARSESSKSSATGMTQFLDATWIGEAIRNGTYLHDKAVKEGWLTKNSKEQWQFKKADGTYVSSPGLDAQLCKLLTSWRTASDKNLQKLLDLRFEAEFAIMASMDYARTNLNALRAKGYAIDDLNDTEKARIMYLCHHLGLADAVHFIQNTIPEEDVTGVNKKGKTVVKQNGAKKLLTTQIGETSAKKNYVKPNDGSWVLGHRDWLQDFMKDNIIPHLFACPGGKQSTYKHEEKNAALLVITDALKK